MVYPYPYGVNDIEDQNIPGLDNIPIVSRSWYLGNYCKFVGGDIK